MKLEDSVRINAKRQVVFKALNDINLLKQAIPGCESMEKIAEDEYEATIVSKVGPMKIRFSGIVKLYDLNPPESYSMRGSGKGGSVGHAKMEARVTLADEGTATVLGYSATADVGGKLAQMGGRLLEGTAKKFTSDFFKSFEMLINGPEDELKNGNVNEGSKSWLWVLLALSISAATIYFMFF